MIRRLFFIGFCFLVTLLLEANFAQAQKLSYENLRYQYDPAALLRVWTGGAVSEDSLLFKATIIYNDSLLLGQRFNIKLLLKKNRRRNHNLLSKSINYTHINIDSNYYYLTVKVPKPEKAGVAILYLQDMLDEGHYFYDVGIDDMQSCVATYPNGDFFPYYKSGDSLSLAPAGVNNGRWQVHYFNQHFAPASIYNRAKDTLQNTPDSVFQVNAKEAFKVSREGVYHVGHIHDSISPGHSFLVVNPHFPEYRSIGQLSQPILYLTTREEYQSIINAGNLKQAYDEFWLTRTRSPNRAKQAIKKYYNRIEYVNLLFTSYKEGWRSTPGLLLTIFGIPDEVYHRGKKEVWRYEKIRGFHNVKIKLHPIVNDFGQSLYILRSSSYLEDAYNSQVNLWRKGRL